MSEAYQQGRAAAFTPRLKRGCKPNTYVLVWPSNPYKWWQVIRWNAWENGKADGLRRE